MKKAEHHGGSKKLATFFLTNKCNLSCPYCYAIENTFREDARFDIEELTPLLDTLAENGYNIAMGGGEPLLEKELVYKIAKEASCRGMGVALLTNGLLLDERMMNELHASGVDWVQISSDSTSDMIRFSRLIRQGAAAGLRMAIGTVLMPGRIDDVVEMHDIMADSCAAGWRLLRYTPLNHTPVEKDDLSNETWIQTLLSLEERIRPLKSPLNIRYEPSVLPFSWLKRQPEAKRLDVCGGRHMRRLFIYPNADVYACGLPRRKGIKIGNFEAGWEGFSQKPQWLAEEAEGASHPGTAWEAGFNDGLPGRKAGIIDRHYCVDWCRGGCIQVRGEKTCDPRCEPERGLVPVCCFEKLLLSSGGSEGELTYPSEVYA